jgi:hypothetical protein
VLYVLPTLSPLPLPTPTNPLPRPALIPLALTCEICASFTPALMNRDSFRSSHTSARDPSRPGSRAAASRTRASRVALGGRLAQSKKWSRA